MSEHAQYGIHPDADLLGAFAEGALPEHERAMCLEHLAGCAECREVVFLAQIAAAEETTPQEQPATAPRRRRWFAPIPVWAAAAAVVVLAVSVVVFSRRKEPTPPTPQLIASATAPTAETPMVPAQPPQQVPVPRSAPPVSPQKKALVEKPLSSTKAPVPDTAPPPVVEAMQPAAPATPAAPPATAPPVFATPQSAPPASASVTGTVTDPAGSAIASAQVSLRDPIAGKTFAAATDSRGEYSLNGIPPGHYQLSFISPGFKANSKTVDLQPQQIARADSALQIGNVAESISVTAESAAMNLSSTDRVGVAGGGGGRGGGQGGRGGAVPPELPLTQKASALRIASGNATISASTEMAPILLLPNKQPPATTAVSGKITLAADSNGVLFLSTNSGKTWKEIKGKWKGKVIRVVAPPDKTNAAGAVFQLTTGSGAIWLSKDGNRWNPAPAR